MKRMAVALGLGLALGSAWAQQVWRCEVDGVVRYTDRPCEKEKSTAPLPARSLQPNVADIPASEPARAAPAASDVPVAAPVAVPVAAPVPAPPAACAADAEAGTCREDTSRPAEAASAALVPAASPPPRRNGRPRADTRWAVYAPQGLMNTDFVQRGYVSKSQNLASKTTP